VDITGWKTVGTKIADETLKEVTLMQEDPREAPTLF
jgi:hypothetical protein